MPTQLPGPEPKDIFACKEMMTELTNEEGEENEELLDAYIQHWPYIRTHEEAADIRRIKLLYVIRKTHPSAQYLAEILRLIHEKQQVAYRLNVQFSFILKNRETGELKLHFHSNNTALFTQPPLIDNDSSFEAAIAKLKNEDFLELAKLQRPNTKWTVDRIVGFAVTVYQIRSRMLM